uniref:DUF4350 domain-containing protein n=1 Tax=Candidatus Methanophagaceae archaeon ANME-1 ERB6 TaxID=2759912 RepID=A0A7G9Z102_9EURY|nr:hypothetical protein NNHBGCAA_00036 [Methanosarcinales archaeon ANME-1 ERB6]
MRWVYAFLVLAGIFLLIVPLAVPTIKTSADFSMFNTNWDGCSEFAKVLFDRGKLVPVLYPYNSIDFKEKGAVIIVGPDVGFSSLEIEEVRSFLEKGGTLFIADDFGLANDLLEGLEVKGKFSDKPLEDIFYCKKADFPVVARIEDPQLSYGVEKLILNIPSVITGLEGEEEVFSSKVSVVGGNRRSYPILAEIRYGAGRVILLSDPDILINDMATENRKFIDNLVGYLGSDLFYFDDAHHSDFNPYSITTVYIHRELDRGKAFKVFAFVVALMVFIESGIARAIGQFIGRLMPARKGEDIFDGLPKGIDIIIVKRIINEIKTGSKFGEGYRYEQGERRKGIYRKAKRGGW